MIIRLVRAKITDNTNLLWTDYDDAEELQTELDHDLLQLEKGNLSSLKKYKSYFLPTATFQEIAVSNAWGDEYLRLAGLFDGLYGEINEIKA